METSLEWILTNSYKADMISYLKSHPDDFEEAIKLAISNKQPYSWRAAWLLWSVMKENDRRIQVYLKRIITTIPDKHDNQQRDLLIILQKMKLSESFEGMLFDQCVSIWKKTSKMPSLRFNAFKIILKIAKNHPGLMHEIILLTKDQYMDSLSSNVKKSIEERIACFKSKKND